MIFLRFLVTFTFFKVSLFIIWFRRRVFLVSFGALSEIFALSGWLFELFGFLLSVFGADRVACCGVGRASVRGCYILTQLLVDSYLGFILFCQYFEDLTLLGFIITAIIPPNYRLPNCLVNRRHFRRNSIQEYRSRRTIALSLLQLLVQPLCLLKQAAYLHIQSFKRSYLPLHKLILTFLNLFL